MIACKLMRISKVGCLPVTDNIGEIIGIVMFRFTGPPCQSIGTSYRRNLSRLD